MTTRSQLQIAAREAGLKGQPCPVGRGDLPADDMFLFHAWLVATTERETGVKIIPNETNANDHQDLRICRQKEGL